jgi:hypothetical protein
MELVQSRIATEDVVGMAAFYARLRGVRAGRPAQGRVGDAPRTQPWGNRSMIFRDPEGNLVNVFSRGQPAGR